MSLSLFILGSLANENSNPYQLKKALLDAIPINISEGKFYYLRYYRKKGLLNQRNHSDRQSPKQNYVWDYSERQTFSRARDL